MRVGRRGPYVVAGRGDLVCRSRAAALAFWFGCDRALLGRGLNRLGLRHGRVLIRGEAHLLHGRG